MADKEKTAYEKVHKQLSDAMQDAYLNDVLKDIEEPKIDLSFLATDNKKKRKHSKLLRIGTVAAAAIIVLLTANIVLMSSDSIDSYGDKGILHRLYEGINGIFTDEDDSESTDVTETFETTDEGDIDKAKKFFPELYVPKYIPEGQTLDKLYIEKYNSGDTICIYNYSDIDNDVLEISCTYCNMDEFEYEYNGTGKRVELEDRTLYLEWDDIVDEYFLTIYTELCTISVYLENCVNEDEIIMIGENIMR